MKNRTKMLKWVPILVVIVISSVFVGFVSANPCDEISSEEKMILNAIPDIESEDLEWLSNRHVYKIYGQVIPFEYAKTEEKWFNDLSQILNKSKPGLDPFFPEGPVCGYGINYLGAIEVYLNENEEYDSTTTDTIYNIIDACGKAEGVNTTPVVFIHAGPFEVDCLRTETYHPIIGGLKMHTQGSGDNTTADIGFAAKKSTGAFSQHTTNSPELNSLNLSTIMQVYRSLFIV